MSKYYLSREPKPPPHMITDCFAPVSLAPNDRKWKISVTCLAIWVIVEPRSIWLRSPFTRFKPVFVSPSQTFFRCEPVSSYSVVLVELSIEVFAHCEGTTRSIHLLCKYSLFSAPAIEIKHCTES